LLWNIIKEILDIASYTVEDLALEFGIKIKAKAGRGRTRKTHF
jgi:hypothetical protein